MARVRIEIVSSETGAHELRGSVSLEDRPLAGAEHSDSVGPFSFSTRLNCRAISSRARSHDTGWNCPSLANSPSFTRISGCVSRSAPYMILERK